MTRVRPIGLPEVDRINAVIESAVGAWPVPDRLRRRACTVLRYAAVDFDDHEFVGAFVEQRLAAIAAWCPGPVPGIAASDQSLLLHGLFVEQVMQGRGLGRRLLAAACGRCRALAVDELLVRVERHAEGFFRGVGLAPVAPERSRYPLTYRLGADAIARLADRCSTTTVAT